MMQTFLIIGSDEKGRLAKAEEIIGKKISQAVNNPDISLLEKKEGNSIGINEVRNLQNIASRKPFQEEKITVIIKEAQFLTIEAQNALLKILEEPPSKTLIALTTPDPSWLLPTIVSRCQIIQLPLKTEIQIGEEESQHISELLNQLLQSPVAHRFKVVEEEGITKDRETAILWLNKLTFVVRQELVSLRSLTPNQRPAPNISVSQYLGMLHSLAKFKKYLEANCNVRLTIENFLLELPGEETNQKVS